MQTTRRDPGYMNSPTLPHQPPHPHHPRQSTSSYGSSEDSYDRLRNHSRSASGTSQTHYDEHLPSPPPRMLMDDFLNQDDEIVDDVLAPKPRQRRLSDILHNQDPGTLHLLLETALTDCEDFEIISPDELNMLKREEQTLARRIAASKQKLFLEMRIRNTAQSLSKLDPKTRMATTNEQNLTPEEQRCNEITLEIYRLEKRLAELHIRRMKHTAGILQIHHELKLQADAAAGDGGGGGGHGLFGFGFGGSSSSSSGRGLGGPRLSLLEADEIIDLPTTDDPGVREKLDQLNHTVYDIIVSVAKTSSSTTTTDAGHQVSPPPPPPQPDDETNDKLLYLENSLRSIQAIAQDRAGASPADGMLADLWHVLRSGEESLLQARERVKNTPIEGVQDRELDADHGYDDAEEDFSHEAFSEKVQRLCNRAQLLSEQHLELRDRILRERESHAVQADESMRQMAEIQDTRASEKARMMEELQDAHDRHLNAQRSFKDAQAQLMDVTTQHAQTRQELDFTKQQMLDATTQHAQTRQELDSARQQVEQRDATLAELQASDSAVTSKLGEVEAEFATLHARLQEAESKVAVGADVHRSEVEAHRSEAEAQRAALEQYRAQKADEMAALEAEKQNYEGEVVRLQTELTVARAELDGAYGTRAQRAAEVASNPEIRKEMAELHRRNGELQTELKELVTEYETMVKQSIDAEKERETLEGLVDTLREKAEALEVKIGEAKIGTAGRPLAATAAAGDAAAAAAAGASSVVVVGGGGGKVVSEMTSMNVLRNEFKRMMRETRSEYFANLRSEQEERRKLESVIRGMRKEQAVAHSKTQPASLTTTATTTSPSSSSLLSSQTQQGQGQASLSSSTPSNLSPQAAPGRSGLSQSVTAS